VLLLLAAACELVGGCAATHFVRPLGRGHGVVTASLGGPLVKLFGGTFPAPIVDLGGGYGVRDDLEVFGHVDVTALAFGILHIDPGFALHPIVSDGGWKPTVTVGSALHLLTNFHDARAVPQLTAACAWRIKHKHMIYAGADLGLGFGAVFHPLWGPFIGGEARIGRVGLALEAKWIAPGYPVAPLAPAWVSPSSQGYLSVLLGVNVYLGGVK
jgi:hypothetical protein